MMGVLEQAEAEFQALHTATRKCILEHFEVRDWEEMLDVAGVEQVLTIVTFAAMLAAAAPASNRPARHRWMDRRSIAVEALRLARLISPPDDNDED